MAVDAEFTKALEEQTQIHGPDSRNGRLFRERGQGDKVLLAASAAAAIAPSDPRTAFFCAVGWILKRQNLADAEKNLREYLRISSPRSDYPSPSSAHYWMGRFFEVQKNPSAARSEYETALKLNSKNKNAQDALKKLDGN